MSVSDYKNWSESHSKLSGYWRRYTRITHSFLYEYFNGAFSSVEIDEVQKTFSFKLFDHQCVLRLFVTNDPLLFEYEISSPKDEMIQKSSFQGNPLLYFKLPTGTIDIRETDSENSKESFFNLMNALISEIRKKA